MLLPVKIGDRLTGEQRTPLQFLLNGKYAAVADKPITAQWQQLLPIEHLCLKAYMYFAIG